MLITKVYKVTKKELFFRASVNLTNNKSEGGCVLIKR